MPPRWAVRAQSPERDTRRPIKCPAELCWSQSKLDPEATQVLLSRKKDTYTGLVPFVGARSASVRRRHTVEPKAGWSGSATNAHNGSLKPGFSGSTNHCLDVRIISI